MSLRCLLRYAPAGLTFALVGISWLVLPHAAAANDPVQGIRIAPLRYNQTITSHARQAGYIDVQNPSGKELLATVTVKKITANGTTGALNFATDERLAKAIVPEQSSFKLPAHASMHLRFTVDPVILGPGGTYAALLVSTTSDNKAEGTSSHITTQAGSLLLLNVGAVAASDIAVQVTGQHWQFGNGITGSATVQAAANGAAAEPRLAATVSGLHATSTKLASHLILPGSSHHYDVRLPGNYFGFLRLTVRDANSKVAASQTVIACTGIYRFVVALIIPCIIGGAMFVKRNGVLINRRRAVYARP